MADTSMTWRDIVLETVRFYHRNPDQVGWNPALESCCYLSPDGRKCAVGRCLLNPELPEPSQPVYRFGDLDSHLKPQYRGHELREWRSLQDLHDTLAPADGWADLNCVMTALGHHSPFASLNITREEITDD